jgi:signal transduction histidine kinase
VHPEDLPVVRDAFTRALQHPGVTVQAEYRVRHKDGSWRVLESLGRNLLAEPAVAGLVVNSRDITARTRAEEHTAALLDVAREISGTLDLHTLLERVQRRAAEVLPCDLVATFTWDPTHAVFRLASHYGIPADRLAQAEALTFAPDAPFGGRLSRREPVVINDISAQAWLPGEMLASFHISALIAVPLQVREHELGALVACTTVRGERFDAEQVALCYGIGRQLAVGIEAAELYRQQQEEAEVAAVLARVGQELIASLNTPVILERLCRLTAEALEGSCSRTFLWQPEEEAYLPVASWGHTPQQQALLGVLKIPPDVAAGLMAQLKEHEVVGVQKLVLSELLPQPLLHQLGLEAALVFPLRRGQQTIGFQTCGSRGQREVTPRQRRVAQGIAQSASLALTNAQLLEELEHANRIKEDFVGTMSHELRTPLNIIIGYSQLMAEETFGPLTAKQADILRRLDTKSRELLDLINATLDLSRLQQRQHRSLTRQAVRGAPLFAELANEIGQLPHSPAVGLEWQIAADLPPLYTDPVKLKMVLKNLILNALKFTDAGAVTVSAQPRQEGVEFRVRDTGIGIPQEALPLIFEPFRQVDPASPRRQGGVGLGLYIVRQLVALLGGKVAVESEVGQGSTFLVWVPATGESVKELGS